MSDDPLAAVVGERVTCVASALFAVAFAFLVANAITVPGTDLAAAVGLASEGSNAYRLLQTLLQIGRAHV